MRPRPSPRLGAGIALIVVALVLGVSTTTAIGSPATASSSGSVPRYSHVFLIILENNGYNQIIGNGYAPAINALAHDYGLATNYHGVADPSEPNYVAMLGGSSFNITSDNPYWFPGNTVNASNLMSQIQSANQTWRGYFQGMPYEGYRGYCYPDKCNGIPDADTQYVSKHNGIVNFADMQTPAEFANLYPLGQLTSDLTNSTVANFSYIVPDECHDMHGAPPWCVDSGNAGTLQEDWLISSGDQFVHDTVDQITGSSLWHTGNDAIVVTFDEGNVAPAPVATIVVTNHGPRAITDGTFYTHYSLLHSLEQAFGVGCLLGSCNAKPMGPLFAITGSKSVPTLPHPFAFPTGPDQVSLQGFGKAGPAVNLTGITNWTVVSNDNLSSQDNVLASVSAASSTDAWAVGTFYPNTGAGVLATLGEHFDGTRWTSYALPDVGVEENTLLGVSMPAPAEAWAVGYYISGAFQQRGLIEHLNGTSWSVVPGPDPSTTHNILYGVAALTDSNAWAVGAEVDPAGAWHTLIEHWDGTSWTVVPSPNPGVGGDQLYAVTAIGTSNVYAVGQQAGTGFPSGGLIEHWNGSVWSVVASPSDPSATALPLAVAGTASSLTIVGQQENDTAGYSPYVASGSHGAVSIRSAPSATPSENDLFGVVTFGNGSAWAVGWAVYDPTNDTYLVLILHEHGGVWSVVPSPGFGPGSVSGLAGIAIIPGGGLWAVGQTTSATGNPTPLIEYHP